MIARALKCAIQMLSCLLLTLLMNRLFYLTMYGLLLLSVLYSLVLFSLLVSRRWQRLKRQSGTLVFLRIVLSVNAGSAILLVMFTDWVTFPASRAPFVLRLFASMRMLLGLRSVFRCLFSVRALLVEAEGNASLSTA